MMTFEQVLIRMHEANNRIDAALAWLTAEPGDPGYREDPRTLLAEVYTALRGDDECSDVDHG